MEKVEKISKLAKDVLSIARNTLVINLRFMDKAISMLDMHESFLLKEAAVNGKDIVYNPIYILKSFSKERECVPRMYLHMILHCVYQHFWIGAGADKDHWDLACDIAVEKTINDLDLDSVRTANSELQLAEIDSFKQNVKYVTADMLYKYFVSVQLTDKEVNRLKKIFVQDNHSLWYLSLETHVEKIRPRNQQGQQENLRNKQTAVESVSNDDFVLGDAGATADQIKNLINEWKYVAKQMKMDLDTFSKEKGDSSGGLSQNLVAVTREKYDYAEFLKKFAVLGERMKINDDEFDYIFYTYGLNLYGKMPLIEPLEYKDVKQIKEFVIAIDTSGSTSGELVQTFVKKTYNILKQSESFFTRFNLHVVQCDAEIQEALKITCQQEFDNYIENMTIKGLGGTDFRPVFGYVDKLIANNEFSNLKGMIYFTDGFGTFPSKQPPYDVAVVYVDDGYENPEVPVWAIKLVLQSEDIRRAEG